MDPLHPQDVSKWNGIREVLKTDWPRGITGYYGLKIEERWLELQADYGFEALVPFGDPNNGFILVTKNEKYFVEILVECPQDDTSKLEEALCTTKALDWSKDIDPIFLRKHVMKCFIKVAEHRNLHIKYNHPFKLYFLRRNSPLFDVRLPVGFTFKLLTEEHIELADSKWPHRYPGSIKYHQLLVRTKSGYGLFKDSELVAFGFIKEMGALGHLFTLEQHRRKGHGETITKLICNEYLKQERDVFSFCMNENIQSCKMHEKIGFIYSDLVYCMKIVPKRIKLGKL